MMFLLYIPFQNCNSETVEPYSPSSEEDEPPPPPPPRGESLTRSYMTEGPPVNRPLPKIPNSASLNDFSYEENDVKTGAPSRPLPIVPNNEEDGTSSDEEFKSPDSNNSLENSNRCVHTFFFAPIYCWIFLL